MKSLLLLAMLLPAGNHAHKHTRKDVHVCEYPNVVMEDGSSEGPTTSRLPLWENMRFEADSGGIIRMGSTDGSRVDRLSDEEYNRLKKVRQAVVDAEQQIAGAHGVDLPFLEPPCTIVATKVCST